MVSNGGVVAVPKYTSYEAARDDAPQLSAAVVTTPVAALAGAIIAKVPGRARVVNDQVPELDAVEPDEFLATIFQ